MQEKYNTILKRDEAEIFEKKSRFIAHTCPVKTEEEAKLFIDEIRKKHKDANHNCFAYQIGMNNEIQRCSDDGEPQGTAGIPILTLLTGEDVKNCCIVVTRYFGGTLLGTGGLVRAYGKCAKEGLLKTGIAQVNTFNVFSINCDYSFQGKMQYMITQEEYILKETIFTDKVEFIVLIESNKIDVFEKELSELTNGKVVPNFLNQVYGAWVLGELIEI